MELTAESPRGPVTDFHPPTPSGKPTLLTKIGPFLLVISSVVVGILLFELFCDLFFSSANNINSKGLYRVIFFDGQESIFENNGNILTYTPRSEIRNLTVFFSDHDFDIEYDYRFKTNNFGLVQDADVLPERDSLVLLGDSFTEGQGAEPWFRLISATIENLGYQPVNGGFMGTGFQDWLKLQRYLAARKVLVRKLVVLFISDDYRRPVRNLEPGDGDFRCLSRPTLCRVEENYFFRLPPREELPMWIAKIRTARAPLIKRGWLAVRAGALLPASYHVYQYLKERLLYPEMIASFERAEQGSRAAIAELIGIYGSENVAFIHLPQKDEIDRPNGLGVRARSSILEAGGKLFDGFKLCGLTKTDYYSNDDHPNSNGYAKIGVCVTNIVKKMMAENETTGANRTR